VISGIRERKANADTSLRTVMAPWPEQVPMEKLEVIASLDDWAQESLLPLLKPVEKSWQPQDFLPDASSESFFDEVLALRERAKELPDDYLDHGRSSPHVPDHVQHFRRSARQDWVQSYSVGRLDPGMDSRGESPWRLAQPISLSFRTSGHAHGGTNYPILDRLGHGMCLLRLLFDPHMIPLLP
jgi:hypothetical protein